MELTPLPVPLAERVEFASSAWLDAARAYLEAGVAAHAASLAGCHLRVCEVYTDPPAHLGYGGEPAAFHLCIDDGVVTVGVGEIDDVDMKAQADYTKAAAAVSAVWEQLPARRARVVRELDHREGGPVFAIKGRIDQSSPAAQVIAGLHDHMARRTLSSPDLDHRLERLGLNPRVADLDRDGYTILEGAFSADLADELAATLRQLILEGPAPHLTAAVLLARGEIFEEAAQHPWVLALAESLLGPGFTLSQSLAFRKAAGIDTHQLHTDYPLIPEPYPEFCLAVTTVWALDDFTETSGPTVVVPGTAKRNRLPSPGAERDAVKIVMPKGSIAMWHGATWHGAAIREDEGERLTLHNTYQRFFTRPFDRYADIDQAVLERNAPIVTTLCGLDDPFEKNTFKGPNRQRLNYARAHYSATGV